MFITTTDVKIATNSNQQDIMIDTRYTQLQFELMVVIIAKS